MVLDCIGWWSRSSSTITSGPSQCVQRLRFGASSTSVQRRSVHGVPRRQHPVRRTLHHDQRLSDFILGRPGGQLRPRLPGHRRAHKTRHRPAIPHAGSIRHARQPDGHATNRQWARVCQSSEPGARQGLIPLSPLVRFKPRFSAVLQRI